MSKSPVLRGLTVTLTLKPCNFRTSAPQKGSSCTRLIQVSPEDLSTRLTAQD